MEERRESYSYDPPEITFTKKEITFPELDVSFNNNEEPEIEVTEDKIQELELLIAGVKEYILDENTKKFQPDIQGDFIEPPVVKVLKNSDVLDQGVRTINIGLHSSSGKDELELGRYQIEELEKKYGLESELSKIVKQMVLNRIYALDSKVSSKKELSIEQIKAAQKIVNDKRRDLEKQKGKNKLKVIDLPQSNAAFILSIVALVVALMFGSFGAIIAIFALSQVSIANKAYKLNVKKYSYKSGQKLKNAKIIGIVAIVIGGLKFIGSILGVYYYGGYYF